MPTELQKPHSHILAEHITPIWLMKSHILIFAEHILRIQLQILISSISQNIFCHSGCYNLISSISQNIFYQSGYRNLISPSSQNIFYQSGCKSLISQHRHNKIAKHAAFTQHPEPRTTPEREAESTDSTLAAAQAPRAAGQPLTQRHGKPSAASAAREYTLLAAFPAREQYDPSLCAALRHITQPGAQH